MVAVLNFLLPCVFKCCLRNRLGGVVFCSMSGEGEKEREKKKRGIGCLDVGCRLLLVLVKERKKEKKIPDRYKFEAG